MKISIKYGIPPLIPLFLLLCTVITIADNLPITNNKTFFDLIKRFPENHISRFVDKGIMDITGIIASKPEYLDGRSIKFDLLTKNIKMNNIKDVTGMIQINVYNTEKYKQGDIVEKYKQRDTVEKYKQKDTVEKYKQKDTVEKYKQGDTIQFKGRIKSFRNFNNPGGFDYVRYMQNKNLWGRVNVNIKDVAVLYNLKNKDSKYYDKYIYQLIDFREHFTNHIFNNIDNKDSSAILCALTTGNKEFISKELQQDFSKTGASHILAISGLHLSIVGMLFFHLFNFLLSLSKFCLIRGWSKKGAAILTIFPLIAYAVLSGFSEATQRAVIMVIIFMTASVVERESNTFNSLAGSGIVILIFDPLSLFTISFQLSFSAVFFILMGLSLSKQFQVYIKTKRVENILWIDHIINIMPNVINFISKNNFVSKFANFIFISICATIGTQILIMHYFNIFSFSGIITNIVVIPGIGFIALPLGLTALFFYPCSISLSEFFVKCADFILVPCITFIKWVADLPFSYVETFKPDIVETACYYFFIAALFALAKFGKNRQLIFIISFLFLIIVIHEALWINKRFFNERLSITVLDVGQGNSALIEMPKGKTALIDGGGFSYSGKFDTGEHIVAPFLRQKKIMTLDAVILTHPDADHLNGLIYIVDHFNVKYFIKNSDEQNNNTYKNLMSGIKKNNSRLIVIDDIEDAKLETVSINSSAVFKIDNVLFQFFHPLNKHKNMEDINNNSLVFKVIFKDNSILFPGDITEDAEYKIAGNYMNELKSDILISPHHGSAGSSSESFIGMAAPETIVISCGWQNRFGFPKDVVIKRYKKHGIKIFRTDLDGAVMLYSDGTKWEIFNKQSEKFIFTK